MPGFHYREILHGGFYFLASPLDERAADLHLEINVPDALALARSRTPTAKLAGELKLEGFADEPHAEGKLMLDLEQKRAIYEISFEGTPDGGPAPARYRLRGHKQLELLNIVDSFTLLRASIYDVTAHETARAVLRFDARGNLGNLLRSFQPTW